MALTVSLSSSVFFIFEPSFGIIVLGYDCLFILQTSYMAEKSSTDEKTEGMILAEVFEDVRELTKFYLHRAKKVDPFRGYEAYGQQLNSLYWIMGHIVWAEHNLLIAALAGGKMDIPWLDKFERGALGEVEQGHPSPEEIRQPMDLVHERPMAGFRAMSNAELAEPNLAGINFRGG